MLEDSDIDSLLDLTEGASRGTDLRISGGCFQACGTGLWEDFHSALGFLRELLVLESVRVSSGFSSVEPREDYGLSWEDSKGRSPFQALPLGKLTTGLSSLIGVTIYL